MYFGGVPTHIKSVDFMEHKLAIWLRQTDGGNSHCRTLYSYLRLCKAGGVIHALLFILDCIVFTAFTIVPGPYKLDRFTLHR